MTARLTLLTASLALAGSIFVSFADADAQTAATPTRSGSIAPAGEGPGAETGAPNMGSTKSRSSVKAQTRSAEKAGMLAPAGESPTPLGSVTGKIDLGNAMAHTGSVQSRRHVKAQTKAARSNDTLQLAGEAPQPSSEAPKK